MQVSDQIEPSNYLNHQVQKTIYKTVEQFSRDNPAFSIPALRNLIFKAEIRYTSKGIIKGNGLLQAGAIVRIGRKVLINESSFYLWIEQQNSGESK